MSISFSPFQLKYGSIEYEFLIPNDDSLSKYHDLREAFNRNIPEPEPTTPAELLAKFMGFVATFVDPIQQYGPYIVMLRYIFLEFRQEYLTDIGIMDFAFSLVKGHVNSEAAKRVKENLVKNYYAAVVKTDFKANYVSRELIDGGTLKTNHAVCYGPGNMDYFALLIELHTLYGAFVDSFLLILCRELQPLIQNDEFAHLYPEGLDFESWLENPKLRPDILYLISAPVSCPLITVTQLAQYCMTCKLYNLSPGEFRDCFLTGTTGHSQGIVASLVIALSESWESFYENALKAVSLMIFIGARVGLTYPGIGDVVSWVREDSVLNGEGRPSPMLHITDLSLDYVKIYVNQTNTNLLESQHIAISLINGPTNVVVSGPQNSLHSLNILLREIKAPNSQEVPPKGRLKFTSKFLFIYAPFHSHLLSHTYNLIAQDISNARIEFSSKDIKIPLYDTHNGANLQEYHNTHQDYSLTSRIVKLFIELPVHWEVAAKFNPEDVHEFGQKDIFGIGLKANEKVEYAFFYGLGDPQYFEIFTEFYEENKDYVHSDLLVPIDAKLKQLIQSNSAFADAYPIGLNFLNWLQKLQHLPPSHYLLSSPVSCPMVTLLQLAHYALHIKGLGLTPGEFRKKFTGATGQSQGIVTAVVIALSDSWDSFVENSVKAASLMLIIGSRSRLGLLADTVSTLTKKDLIKNLEGWPSSTLKISDLSLKQVEIFISQANERLPVDRRIAISLFNSPTSFCVAGPPNSLCALVLILRKHKAQVMKSGSNSKTRTKLTSIFRKKKAPNELEQEASAIPQTKQTFSYKFTDIQDPFNSYLLKDVYQLIVDDLAYTGIEFSSKDIQIPVYDCHNGANLQDYDKSYSFTSRLVKLVIELPVYWEEAAKSFDISSGRAYGTENIF